MENNPNNRNILLIYPPSLKLNREDSSQQPTEIPIFPYDLVLLANIAEANNYTPTVRDYNFGGNIINDIVKLKPIFVLISITTPSFKTDMEIIAKIKEIYPPTKIIVKGSPFIAYNTNAIYENQHLDYVIIGEAEETFKEIIQGVADCDIKGICYRENFQPAKTEKRHPIQNLDTLGLLDRKYVNNYLYRNPITQKIQATILISRGCNRQCFFCLAPMTKGNIVRYRSPQIVIDEIKDCINKYKIKDFKLLADNINQDENWLIDFCNAIIKENLKITWTCDMYPRINTDNLASLMYKAGCRYVNLGIETGSKSILKKLNKGLKLKNSILATRALCKAKIKVTCEFIIGFPWDTEETIKDSVKFAQKLNYNFCKFNIATPLPGSAFFAYTLFNGFSKEGMDFTKSFKEPVVRTNSLSKEKILEIKKFALQQVYFNPKFILRNIVLNFNIRELLHYIKLYKTLL